MSDTSTGNGKVVVNRAMSLDGFIAGPGHAMDWIFDFVAPTSWRRRFPEIAAATGAMLIGRRTYEVGKQDGRRGARQRRTTRSPEPCSSSPIEPPDPPDPDGHVPHR